MNFPDNFIEKCKEVYPEWNELHEALENGNSFACRYLDDARMNGISNEEILEAESLDRLKKRAKEIKAVRELYSKALELYRKQVTN